MPTQYTIELLPANGNAQCVEGDISVDGRPRDRHVPHPLDGPPARRSKLKRSIVASFRRKSFLDFLYFTDFETTDPINYSGS